MFAREADALVFMDQCRQELRRNRRDLLISDAEVYWDAIRAREVLRDHPGLSLEYAAYLLLACKSPKERRGGSFEAPVNRTIKLEPREWLGLEGAAKELGYTMEQLLRKAAWKIIEAEAQRLQKEDRELAKRFGWWDENHDGGLKFKSTTRSQRRSPS
jgi:hypothetical protein